MLVLLLVLKDVLPVVVVDLLVEKGVVVDLLVENVVVVD